MWCINSNTTITRDQFTILPMPDIVRNHITSLALSEGFTRGADPIVDQVPRVDDTTDVVQPEMMDIVNRNNMLPADETSILPEAGVNSVEHVSIDSDEPAFDEPVIQESPVIQEDPVEANTTFSTRQSARSNRGKTPSRFSDYNLVSD
jgi:hypothetical protein